MLQPDFSVEDRLDTLKDSSMESGDDATMMQAVQPGEQVVVSQSLMKFQKTAVLTTVGALLGMVLVVGAVVLFANHGSNKGKGQANNLQNFPVTTSVLSGLSVSPKSAPQLGVASAKQLVVNGQLEVGDTLVISPSAKPKAAVPGQIYYDKATNAPYFYNGTEFISLAQTPVPQHVASIGGTSGQISVGSGLQVTAGQLSLSTDALRALTGPKVASLVSGSATLAISQDGNGNYTLSDSALVGAGSAGQIAFYTGSGTLGASILSQSGTTVTVGGALAVDTIQQTAAGNPIVVNAGNDGITFTANGINYQLPASGGANQVICTTGAPCASGGGSLVVLQPGGAQLDNGSGSSVFINNTGGGNLLQLQGSGSDRFVVTNTGNTTIAGSVTISSLTTAGIVQVNGAGLLSGGAVDRNSATLFSGTLSVSNGGTGLTSVPANGIVYGNGTGALQSTAAAANSILTTNGTSVPVLAQTLPSVVQGNITTTGTLTSGAIGAGFGAISTANNITTSGGIQGGSLTITSGNFTVDASGNVVVKGTGTIQGSGGVFIGVANTTNGNLTFYNSTNGHFMQLQGLAPAGQDATITIPATTAATDTICLLTLGNCVGKGGAVSTSGGSQFYIPKYTNLGATQLGNSLLYDNGTSVGVNTSTPGASYKFDVSGDTHVSGTETIGGGLTVSAGGASIVGNSVVTGTLTGLTALTSGGTITFSGLSTGVVHTNASGVLSSGNVVLGTETSGNYVASLGTLTGLTTTGNGVAGSTPTLSVTYGNLANTAVEGNKQLTVTASTGLSGGGTVTLGSGGTVSLSVAYGSAAGTAVQGNTTLTVTAGTGLTGGGTVTLGAGSSTSLAVAYGSSAGTAVQGNTQVTVTAGSGLSGGGSLTLGAGGSTSLSVAYGSSVNTAVQGNTTLTCPSGTGNLSGGGGTITLGTGGSCGALDIISSPTLTGTLTVTGSGGIVVGAASTTDGVLKLANSTSTFLGSVKVASLAQATVYTLPDPGASTATICLDTGNCASSGGGVTTAGGTANKLAKFSGSGTIADSSLSESGTTLTASGNIVIQGANSLSLGTASTADGSIKFFNAGGTHTVTLQAPSTDPASNLVFKLPSSYGASGDCLKSDGLGGLSISSCTGGGGGGVTSLDSQTGALTLSNSSGSSGIITIDDASTTQKGIAQFNATNFSVTGGVVNTVQGISTAASPTFAGLSLTSALGVGSGGTGANTFTSNGILYGNGSSAIQATGTAANSILATNGSSIPSLTNTLPSAVQGNITTTGVLTNGSIASGFGAISTASAITTTVALQGGSFKLSNGTNSNIGTIVSATILQNTTYTLPDPGQATATICLSTGNCASAGGGVTTTGGTTGKLSKFSSSNTIVDSGLSEASTTLTYAGNMIVNAGLGFTGNLIDVQLNGSTKLSVTDTGNASVAGNLTVSGTGTSSFGGGVMVAGTLTVSSGGAAITGSSSVTGTLGVSGLATLSGDLQVGTPSSTNGSIYLANSGSGRMVVLQGLNPSGTGNATIQFPTIPGGATDTVCLLTKGNCTGNGLSGTGTQDKIPKYGAGGNSLGDSSINDDGTTVSITNENFSQTGTGTFGTGTGIVSLNGATTVTSTNNFTVTGGTTSLGGAATVSGLTTLNGGLTAIGSVAINTTGTASTTIGNSSGGLTLTSSTWNVSSAGAVSGVTTLSASGAITAATSSNTINGLVISSGALSSVAGITTTGSYTQSGVGGNTFTGASTFSASGTGLSVSNNASIGGTLNVTSSTGIVLGSTGIDGLLSFTNATNSNIATLKAAAPSGTGTATITIPSIPGGTSDTVCLRTKANCAGAGGYILNNGATQNYIPRVSNSGATEVANSLLYDDTNFIGLNTTTNNGTLSVVANGTQAGIYVQGPASGTSAVATLNGGGGTGKLLQLQNSGSTVLAFDTTGKLLFGSAADTNLYRSAAGILKTDGDLQVVGKGYAAYGTASQLTFGDILGTGKSGIYLGSSNDTNLYRSTANTLKTDSAFVTGGTITIGTLAASSSNLLCLDGSSAIASCAPTAGTNSFILNSTSLQNSANFNFQASAAGTVGGIIRGAASQTSDLFQLQNSSGTILSKFDANGILRGADASGSNIAGSALTIGGGQGTGTGNGGNIAFNIYKAGTSGSSLNTTASSVLTLSGTNGSAIFKNATDSTTAFQIQNASSVSLLTADTSNTSISISNTNSYTTATTLANSLLNVVRSTAANTGSVTSGGNQGAGPGTSIAATVTTQNNRILIVAVSSSIFCSSYGTTSAVTYGGVSMTKLTSADSGFGCNQVGVSLWYLVNPASSGTISATTNGGYNSIAYADFYNVDTSNPFGSTNTAISAGYTVTGTSTSEMVVGVGGAGSTPTSISSVTDTARTSYGGGGSNTAVIISSRTGAAGSLSNTFNSSGGSPTVGAIGAVLRPAGLTVSSSVAQVSSQCTITSGSCTDSSNVLSLNQQYSSATGAVLNIQNSGSGADIQIGSAGTGKIQTAAGTSTNGISIQSGVGTTGTSGAVALQSGSMTSGTSGAVTLQSGGTTSGTSGSLTLSTGAASGTGNTGSITISTGSTVGGVGFSTGSISIDTGSTSFGLGTSGNISIGTGTYTHSTTIGNVTGGSGVTLQGGTASNAISIQSNTGGTISIGANGIANTLQIGNTSGAVAQTINIGNNATASSSTALTIGSAIGASPVTIQSGTTGTALSSTATTGTALAVTANSLTSGSALSVATTSANFSGNLVALSSARTVTAANSYSSNILDIQKSYTANIAGATGVTLDTSGGTTSATSWTQTVNARTNQIMIIEVVTTSCTPTGITVNGSSATYISGGGGGTGIYYFASPPTGTVTIAQSGCSAGSVNLSSQTYYNVDISGTPYTTSSATGTSASPTTTLSGTNAYQYALDYLKFSANGGSSGTTPSATPGGGQTNNTSVSGFGICVVGCSGSVYGSSRRATGSGSTTMSWTPSNLGDYSTFSWTEYGVLLNPASVPAVAVTGSAASIRSNCTETSGVCQDSSNVLSLSQQFASATGAVFSVQNAGTGAAIALTQTGGSTIDIQLATGKIQTAAGTTSNAATLQSGNATAGASGAVTLQSGTGTTGTGAISIKSGNASAGASGGITIDTGTYTSGTPTISIGTATAAAVSIGRTGQATTVNGSLTVTQAVTFSSTLSVKTITIAGHIITSNTSGSTTFAGVAGGICSSAPTVSASAGNDTSGVIVIDTTPGGCAASDGTAATITFANSFGVAPNVVMTAANTNAADRQAYVDTANVNTTSFKVSVKNGLSNTTVYKFYYHVLQ